MVHFLIVTCRPIDKHNIVLESQTSMNTRMLNFNFTKPWLSLSIYFFKLTKYNTVILNEKKKTKKRLEEKKKYIYYNSFKNKRKNLYFFL
jgi:hypothetical protein